MCVLRMRAGRESYGLVAGGELDVKPCNHGVDVVVTLAFDFERAIEGQVCGGDGVEIELEDGARVADDSFELDGVDERFCKSDVLDGLKVEAVDVVPN